MNNKIRSFLIYIWKIFHIYVEFCRMVLFCFLPYLFDHSYWKIIKEELCLQLLRYQICSVGCNIYGLSINWSKINDYKAIKLQI